MQDLLTFLQDLIAAPGGRERLIYDLHELADELLGRGAIPPDKADVVAALLQDLAYYVESPEERREDSSYYGDDELERRLRAALAELAD